MPTKYSRSRLGAYRVHYQCPNCKTSLRSPIEEAGCRDYCPDCKSSFEVPGTAKKEEVKARLAREVELLEKKRAQKRWERAQKRRERAEKLSKAKSYVSEAVTRALQDGKKNERIRIDGYFVIGRSLEKSDWLVSDPQVSETHAGIFWQDTCLNLIDLGSRIGTLLNNDKVEAKKVRRLCDGDIIRIGPVKLQVDGQDIEVLAEAGHAYLNCYGLCKDVVDTGSGETIRILNSVDVNVEAGEFTVLLGPSGSGKSTLLNAMSGRALATQGAVFFNEESLYSNFDRLKTRIATVAQKDLLHSELSLRSSLGYTADIRLPSDLTTTEKNGRIERVIREVEMVDHVDSKIANYSGGQLKRASLANELLADPCLLFVDEATSGLDEHSDREIMAMMRKLADAGKTIVCITHNLGNVPEYVHKLVVMADGGYLAFIGSPAETLEYFSIKILSDLYMRLKDKSGKQWSDRFEQRRQGRNEETLSNDIDVGQSKDQRHAFSLVREIKTACRHGIVSFKRTAELQFKDKNSLTVAVAQPIFVFVLIWFVFGWISVDPGLGNRTQIANGLSILFLLGISSFWFGCSNSAKEVVKERELFERERNAGLSPIGYFASKVAFLFSLTILQSWFLLLAVYIATNLDGNLLLYGTSVSATAICGVALGLAISALSPNTDVASTAVPLAIIPQVILAGMIKPLDGFPEYVAWFFAPSYWCFGSMSHVWNELWNTKLNSDGMLAQQEFGFSILVLMLFTAIFFAVCCFSLAGVRIPFVGSNR